MRYYFNIEDGVIEHDTVGTDLPGLGDARSNALRLAGSLLAEGAGADVWSGRPLKILVTTGPDATGDVVLEITVSAREAADVRPM